MEDPGSQLPPPGLGECSGSEDWTRRKGDT